MTNNIVKLGGLGELDQQDEKEIKSIAKKYGVKLFPTYYDFVLEGTKENIEKVTQEIWGMPEDQWGENGLSIY